MAWVTALVAPLFLVVRWLLPVPLNPPYQQVANPLAVHDLTGPLQVARAATSILTVLAVVAASLVVGFRRARGVERLRLRRVALAAVLSAVLAVLVTLATVLRADAVIIWGLGLYVAVLPLAVGAAVLRYRLYDPDRIVSRALAYGPLTVLLGAGYAAVVLGLGRLLPEDSSLAVAAAFQPARRRIQQAVDRRFNRRRYDAGRTIESFGARLHQRVDLDGLTAELLAVVDQTMQPTRASLWLRP